MYVSLDGWIPKTWLARNILPQKAMLQPQKAVQRPEISSWTYSIKRSEHSLLEKEVAWSRLPCPMGIWNLVPKALVRSKNLATLMLALRWRIWARAQFFRDLALALPLKTFWAPLNFALILRFQRAFNTTIFRQQTSSKGQYFPHFSENISKTEKSLDFCGLEAHFF